MRTGKKTNVDICIPEVYNDTLGDSVVLKEKKRKMSIRRSVSSNDSEIS
uniref:Uncharacterized protein n=1 Tax=Onchocerca volvulus TaxID=6282 RepID=A0A2K6W8S8_ONCVO